MLLLLFIINIYCESKIHTFAVYICALYVYIVHRSVFMYIACMQRCVDFVYLPNNGENYFTTTKYIAYLRNMAKAEYTH